jgi:hypothetical protein
MPETDVRFGSEADIGVSGRAFIPNANWGGQSFRRRYQTVQNRGAPLSELLRSQVKATNICHPPESEITRSEVQYRY